MISLGCQTPEFGLLWERPVTVQVRGGPPIPSSGHLNPGWASWSGKVEMEKHAPAQSDAQGGGRCLKEREGAGKSPSAVQGAQFQEARSFQARAGPC